MKAFVTGSTGLLGNNLIRLLLAQGHEVKALARTPEKAERLLGDTDVEIVIGDMADVPAFARELAGCDVLFHGAAFFREYFQPGDHWSTLKQINVDATVEILSVAEEQGVGKAIFVSSSGVIGTPINGKPADEETPPGTLAEENLYFQSKVQAEAAVQKFLKKRAMPVVLVLPGWMFGPYDAAPTASGRLVLDFLDGALPGRLDGGGIAVDARDVAQAMVNAVEHGRSGERYIVAGEHQSLDSIMDGLEEASGVTAPKMRIPYPVAIGVATIAQTIAKLQGKPALMTVAGLRTLRNPHLLSSEKARQELGVRFRPFQETLTDEVNWFRSVGLAD